MATTSTVPAVRSALVTLLRAALPSVQVEYGRPQDSAIRSDIVVVGDVEGRFSYPVMKAGRKVRQEEYTVTVLVASAAPAALGNEATDGIVDDLVAALEDELADDPTLGVADIVHATLGDFVWPAPEPGNDGPVVVVEIGVDVLARLS